jgi:hypothetical protein
MFRLFPVVTVGALRDLSEVPNVEPQRENIKKANRHKPVGRLYERFSDKALHDQFRPRLQENKQPYLGFSDIFPIRIIVAVG